MADCRLTLFETARCATARQASRTRRPRSASRSSKPRDARRRCAELQRVRKSPPHALRNREMRDDRTNKSCASENFRLTLFETARCATIRDRGTFRGGSNRLTLFETARCATDNLRGGCKHARPPHALRNREMRDPRAVELFIRGDVRLTLFETARCATIRRGSTSHGCTPASRSSKPRDARPGGRANVLWFSCPPHALRNREMRDLRRTVRVELPLQPPHALRNREMRDRASRCRSARSSPPHALRNREMRDSWKGERIRENYPPPHALRNREMRDLWPAHRCRPPRHPASRSSKPRDARPSKISAHSIARRRPASRSSKPRDARRLRRTSSRWFRSASRSSKPRDARRKSDPPTESPRFSASRSSKPRDARRLWLRRLRVETPPPHALRNREMRDESAGAAPESERSPPHALRNREMRDGVSRRRISKRFTRLTLFETARCATAESPTITHTPMPPHALRNREMRDPDDHPRRCRRSPASRSSKPRDARPEFHAGLSDFRTRLTLFETARCATDLCRQLPPRQKAAASRSSKPRDARQRRALTMARPWDTASRSSKPRDARQSRIRRGGERADRLTLFETARCATEIGEKACHQRPPPHALRNREMRDFTPGTTRVSTAIRLTLFETARCATMSRRAECIRRWPASRSSKPRDARRRHRRHQRGHCEPPHALRNREMRDPSPAPMACADMGRLTLFETARCATGDVP